MKGFNPIVTQQVLWGYHEYSKNTPESDNNKDEYSAVESLKHVFQRKKTAYVKYL